MYGLLHYAEYLKVDRTSLVREEWSNVHNQQNEVKDFVCWIISTRYGIFRIPQRVVLGVYEILW